MKQNSAERIEYEKNVASAIKRVLAAGTPRTLSDLRSQVLAINGCASGGEVLMRLLSKLDFPEKAEFARRYGHLLSSQHRAAVRKKRAAWHRNNPRPRNRAQPAEAQTAPLAEPAQAQAKAQAQVPATNTQTASQVVPRASKWGRAVDRALESGADKYILKPNEREIHAIWSVP